MMRFRWAMMGAWLLGAGVVGAVPCLGQSVVYTPPVPARDSAARPPADTAAAPKPSVPPSAPKGVAPADTVLDAACAGVGRGGVAQDLVVVVFSAGVGADERAAAVKGAGGMLVARPGAADDETYVRPRAAANGESAQSLADRLIQLRQVRSVSLAPCPVPTPALLVQPSPSGDTGKSAAPPAGTPPNSPAPR